MRSRLQRRAQSSEEVGQRIAGEMSQQFTTSLDKVVAQSLVKQRLLAARTSLRTALYEAVEGFNGHAPWDYHLAVLNRGDRLLFNSFGQFTLTVTFGDDQVMIHPQQDPAVRDAASDLASDAASDAVRQYDSESPTVVDVVRVDGSLRYRAGGESALFQTPVLTELQFVDGLIRMACERRAARQAVC